jgi:hypothetical protein
LIGFAPSAKRILAGSDLSQIVSEGADMTIPDDVMKMAEEVAGRIRSRDDAAQAIARAIMAERERQWRPIETAPKDGTAILLGHECAAFSGWWDDEYEWVDGETSMFGDLTSYEPTHWMPLPQPPQSERDSHEGD